MLEFFKQYIPYYKNYKKEFFFAIIGMIMVSAGTSGTAYIIKPVLDDVFINKNEEMLHILPLGVIFLYMLKGFGRYIQTYYISYIGTDIIRIVRDKFLRHILHQDMKFFSVKHGGELISRVGGDISAIQSAISSNLAVIVMETLTIIALVGIVIYQSPTLAFYGLIVLPTIIYPLSVLAKKMKKLARISQEKGAVLMAILSEIFNNIEIIIANNSQDHKMNQFSNQNKEIFSVTMKGVKTNAAVSPLMETVGAFAAALVIVMGGMEVIDDKMSVGSFFSFMTALFMLYTPIKRLSSVYNQFQSALAANDRINTILATHSTIKSGAITMQSKIEKISFKNISLKYDTKQVLNNINIEVKKGEKIALVGDSGGGKSSLVNLLLRFYDPYEGEILFNDTNINNLSFQNLRDSISVVTQRVYIFNDTIANNITFGDIIDEERVLDVLKQAHALDFVNQLENGIYTILDEFGSNLSGGQRQRIAIARALYKQPEILIFDEATSALDNQSESIISKVLDEISKDKITFVIAHRLSTIKNADKIVVLKNGNIVCKGNEEKLLTHCEEYKRLHLLAQI